MNMNMGEAFEYVTYNGWFKWGPQLDFDKLYETQTEVKINKEYIYDVTMETLALGLRSLYMVIRI